MEIIANILPSGAKPVEGAGKFRLSYLLWLLLLVPLLPGLVHFFSHSWQVLNWEWQIDFDEGFNLSATTRLTNLKNIYPASSPDYFVAAPYPPGYYFLTAFLSSFMGTNLLSGRLLSFLGALTIAFLIFLFIRKISKRYWQVDNLNANLGGLFGALIWLTLNPTIIWSTFFKQDMTAMALAIAGLWLTWAWDDHPTAFNLVGGTGLLALSFYTKQNELAAGVAAGLYLSLKNFRRSWKFNLVLLLLLVVPFIVVDVVTRQRFYFHVFEAQQVPFSWNDLWRRLLTRIFPDHVVLIALAAVFAGCESWRAVQAWLRRKWYAPQLLTIWLAGGTFTLVTVGAYQSGYNHALDFLPPVLVASGVVITKIIDNAAAATKRLIPWLLAILVGVALLWQTLVYPQAQNYYSFLAMPSPGREKLNQQLLHLIEDTPGEILSEDIYLQLKAGRPVIYDSLYHMQVQAKAGIWDESQFLTDLRTLRFSLILVGLDARRFTNQGFTTFNQNYQQASRDSIEVWKPLVSSAEPRYPLSCTLGDSLHLAGVSYGRDTKDGLLEVVTYWHVDKRLATDYTFYLHLVNNDSKMVAQRDEPPIGRHVVERGLEIPPTPAEAMPTSRWQPGEWFLVEQNLPLPEDFDPQKPHSLLLGAYSVGIEGKLITLPSSCNNQPAEPITLPQPIYR